MRKHRDTTKPLKNRTEERLRATPFTDIKEMEQERYNIQRQTWRRLAEAQIFAEMLTKEEFALVKAELGAGLSCKLEGAPEKSRLFHIYSKGRGILLDLNETYVKKLGDGQIPLLQGTIQAGIAGWGSLYYQTMGLIPRLDGDAMKALNNGFPPSDEK